MKVALFNYRSNQKEIFNQRFEVGEEKFTTQLLS